LYTIIGIKSFTKLLEMGLHPLLMHTGRELTLMYTIIVTATMYFCFPCLTQHKHSLGRGMKNSCLILPLDISDDTWYFRCKNWTTKPLGMAFCFEEMIVDLYYPVLEQVTSVLLKKYN